MYKTWPQTRSQMWFSILFCAAHLHKDIHVLTSSTPHSTIYFLISFINANKRKKEQQRIIMIILRIFRLVLHFFLFFCVTHAARALLLKQQQTHFFMLFLLFTILCCIFAFFLIKIIEWRKINYFLCNSNE